MEKSRKYDQLVYSEMRRFRDPKGNWYKNDDGKCILVRNKTRVEFGKENNLTGTVIMTNPGSFSLGRIPGWKEFEMGIGNSEFLEGYGYPDLTMRNIIFAVQQAYQNRKKIALNGYINIYNISSAVCPKGKAISIYHEKILSIINENKIERFLLEHPIVHNQDEFAKVCKNSPFVLMGFLKDKFKDIAAELLKWASTYDRLVVSADRDKWPSHPRRWKTEKALGEKAIEVLSG
ncbi:MAG: hypothetical protein PHO01_02900 [Desulfotomaculaceae bacterium]|nr:hypothetical protein [Desulfotomaculaceae bacterium]